MFGNKKRKIPVSKQDLKQAILKANDRLKKANKALEQDIKSKQSTLKEITEECDNLATTNYNLSKDIELGKVDIERINADKAISRSALGKTMDECRKWQEEANTAEKQQKELSTSNSKLKKAIVKLEEKKATYDIKAKDIKKISSECTKLEEQCKEMLNQRQELQIEAAGFEIETSLAKAKYEESAGALSGQQAIIDSNMEALANAEKAAIAKHKKKLEEMASIKDDKHDEIEVLSSLVSKKEEEYIAIEGKLVMASKKLTIANNDIEEAGKEEVLKVERIKSAFKGWKLKALEDVAKLKLKGKIESIDKAGLKDILNG